MSVTVLLGGDAERVADILSSVLDQTFGDLEVLVARAGREPRTCAVL